MRTTVSSPKRLRGRWGKRGSLAATAATVVALGATAAWGVSSASAATKVELAAKHSSKCKGTKTVTYASPIANLSQASVIVAQDAGYFNDHCITLTMITAHGGTNASTAAISGSVDLAGTDPLVVLVEVSKGAPLEAVDLGSTGIPFDMVVSKSYADSHGLTKPVKTFKTMVKKIKGMTIGNMAPGDTGQLILFGLIKSAGQTPTTWITANSARGVATQLAALQHTEIQATFTDVPTPQLAVDAGYAKIFWGLETIKTFQTIAYNVIVSNPSWANSHAKIVKEFNSALAQANKLMIKKPAKAARYLRTYLEASTNKTPEKTIANTLKDEGYKTHFTVNKAWKLVQTIGNKFKMEKFTITSTLIKKSYTTKFEVKGSK